MNRPSVAAGAPGAAAREAEPVVRPAGPLIPLIIGCALFMQNLDATVIANALPAMAASMRENPLTMNLAITVYLLATAVFLPVSGWVADRFGAKHVFRAAMLLFAFSSLLCGLSQNLPELLGARLLQGVAGAMMTPVGRLMLLRSVPKSELLRAMSYVTVPALLGPVLGPPIGGLIVTYLHWSWIFFINIPMAVLGVTLVSLFVGDVREDARRPLDWPGFLLTGAGLGGVMFGFQNLGRGIAPLWAAAALFLIGGLCLLAYHRRAIRTRHPILDLSVFRIQTFTAATVGGAFVRFSIGATPFLLALLLQMGFGLTPFVAGMMTFASAAGALLMKATAGPILRRLGFKATLLGNTVVTALIFAGYALFGPKTSHLLIVVTLLVGGFLRSLQFTALNALAFADVPPSQMSAASTLASMGMSLSQGIGVGLAAIVLYAVQTLHGSTVLKTADVSPGFVVIAALSMLALLFFVPLPRNAGAEVSGAGGLRGQSEPIAERDAI